MKLGTTLVIPAVALLETAPMAATLLAVWVITRHSRVELTRNKRSLSLRVARPSDKMPISSCYERLLLTVTFCFSFAIDGFHLLFSLSSILYYDY